MRYFRNFCAVALAAGLFTAIATENARSQTSGGASEVGKLLTKIITLQKNIKFYCDSVETYDATLGSADAKFNALGPISRKLARRMRVLSDQDRGSEWADVQSEHAGIVSEMAARNRHRKSIANSRAIFANAKDESKKRLAKAKKQLARLFGSSPSRTDVLVRNLETKNAGLGNQAKALAGAQRKFIFDVVALLKRVDRLRGKVDQLEKNKTAGLGGGRVVPAPDERGPPTEISNDRVNVPKVYNIPDLVAPIVTVFGGATQIKVNGLVLGVTNFNTNNTPIAGKDKPILNGGTFGVRFDGIKSIGGLSLGERWTFGLGSRFSVGEHSGRTASNPPAGSNSLLFPVSGGGAIGASGLISSRIDTKYWQVSAENRLTYWHHRNPNSHLGFFVAMGLAHAVMTQNELVAANNLAFGNLTHTYRLRQNLFIGSLLFGIVGKKRITRSLFFTATAFAGLNYVRARLRANSCLDISPAPGCDGLFSTASIRGNKEFVSPSFGVTAGLTALFACSKRAQVLGACALATLELGYKNSPFVKPTHITSLGQNLGLGHSRLQQFHAMLKISVPLSLIIGNSTR